MKLAHFYESVRELESGEANAAKPGASARRIELANEIVAHLRNEFDCLYGYQQKYNPSLEDEKDDGRALEVLRSIWQMFGAWVDEAEPVFEAVKRLPAARHVIQALDALGDNIGMARARLSVKPEDIINSVQQLRRGEGIRTTVQELRNELRAQRRA